MPAPFAPPERIGFVGLGQMGAPMARNLARAGFRLALADANAQAVARLTAELGCEAPSSLATLGAACRVVITMLPDGQAVREVAAALELPRDAILLDMSSSSPVGTRELGRALAERGVALVDAPVSGGVRKAVDGSLSIMAGGDPATIERVRPILAAMGKQIFVTGPLGAGHAMKALNNYVSAAGFAAATEAVLAGSRFGLDPATIVAILNASTGRNNSTENKFPQFVLPRAFNAGFTMALMVKDLRTALDVAHAAGTPAPLAEACVEAWARAEQLLGGQADHTAAVQYWERLAGAEIRGG
jgi:3-hydroxyisobutyrate dehydrogenase